MRTIIYIPLIIKIKILFSNKLTFLGLFVLGIPSIIMIAFLPNVDFHDTKYSINNTTETKGIIKSLSETNNSVNGERVIEYDYEFHQKSNLVKGKSYGVTHSFSIGDTVDVEFLTSDYSISRIKGFKNGAFEINTVKFLLGIIVIGLLIFIKTLYQSINLIKILRNGFEIIPGKLELELKAPKLSIRKTDPYYRLKFTYIINGYDFKKVIYTAVDEFSMKRLRLSNVIVDSSNDSRAYIFEALPIDVRTMITDYSTIANNM